MEDRTASGSQVVERRARRLGGGISTRLVVGEYVGQRASAAAQAVRCAGLKPGLERSFGFDPELVGEVVEQSPPAGSELARNGLVTLYVAAPGTQAPADATLREGEGQPSSVETLEEPPIDANQPPEVTDQQVRRRRKPGRATGRANGFADDLAPAPRLGRAESGDLEAERVGEVSPETEVELGARQEEGDFVVLAEEMFGRDAGRVRDRVRRRGVGVFAGEHRWLVRGVAAVLVLWLLVAGISAVGRDRAAPHSVVGTGRPTAQSSRSQPMRPKASQGRPAPAAHDVEAPRRVARRRPVHAREARRIIATPPARLPTDVAPREGQVRDSSPRGEGGPFSP
jgi:hypothetical protein